jgi:glycosyltransferase involved in cell wall biosynthesis
MKMINYFVTQLKISYQLKKIAHNSEIWIFFVGGNTLILPMVMAKLLRKKVVLALPGSSLKSFQSSPTILSKPISFLEEFNRFLSNRIILYSPNLVKEWHLQKYEYKISIADRHFVDFDTFKINKNLDERKNLVGFIGRFSKEKGIIIFIEAIQIVSKKREDIEFIIGGDGALHETIINYIQKNNLESKVKLVGWIPHDELPKYLNQLKLLVLPSYTEGLPNIILEAMACGTPVLTTPVGAIPDVIHDGENGFIIKNNTQQDIAEDVIRILEHPSLELVVKNAKKYVEKNYTYAAKVENYEKILQDII